MIMNDDGKNKDQVYILLSKQKRVRHIVRTRLDRMKIIYKNNLNPDFKLKF